MPKNEDGEFELVLGNKQLLSMFFVVVVLLGVFFVMGYVVGRNSAPLISSEPAHKAEPKAVADATPVPTSIPDAVATPAPEKSASAPEPAPASPTPAPAAPVEAAPPKPEPAPKHEAKVVEKTAPAKEDAAPQAKAHPAAQGTPPSPGATFLQLSATDKADADKMVDVLRKSGFQAIDAEVPEKPGLFRVLVGPIASGDFNKVKADLQSKGFPGNAAIKKTF